METPSNCMLQGLSWATENYSAGQEIHWISPFVAVLLRHFFPSVILILIKMQPAQTLPSYFSRLQSNIILSMTVSPKDSAFLRFYNQCLYESIVHYIRAEYSVKLPYWFDRSYNYRKEATDCVSPHYTVMCTILQLSPFQNQVLSEALFFRDKLNLLSSRKTRSQITHTCKTTGGNKFCFHKRRNWILANIS
jgi:hypothetical protein